MKNGQKSSLYGEVSPYSEEIPYSEPCITATIEHMIGAKRVTPISPKKRRNALKMVILTKKSKNFIKAKLTVSKSYLLGLVYLMISCIIRDAHL